MTQEQEAVATARRHRPHVKEPEKSSRAFAAYIDLMDTADLLRDKMSRQLTTWNLTMMQFRVMETIYRNGPQYQQELSRKFACSKQNVGHVIKSLVGCGCLRLEVSHLERTSAERWVNPRDGAKMKRPAHGRRVVLVRLTEEGERLIAYVFPRHRKVVKAEMRALEGREQETLSRLCRKLKEGDIVKFFKEIRMRDADEKPW
jgi:MarR family transcriptional regulator, 2-MHQ and catechol-resistance regulon repressor